MLFIWPLRISSIRALRSKQTSIVSSGRKSPISVLWASLSPPLIVIGARRCGPPCTSLISESDLIALTLHRTWRHGRRRSGRLQRSLITPTSHLRLLSQARPRLLPMLRCLQARAQIAGIRPPRSMVDDPQLGRSVSPSYTYLSVIFLKTFAPPFVMFHDLTFEASWQRWLRPTQAL